VAAFDPMWHTDGTNPMSNSEIFWRHERNCDVCNQHPQSVASFYYEPMCNIGRAYAEAAGLWRKEMAELDVSASELFREELKRNLND